MIATSKLESVFKLNQPFVIDNNEPPPEAGGDEGG